MTIYSNNSKNRHGTIFAYVIVQGNNSALNFMNVYYPDMNMRRPASYSVSNSGGIEETREYTEISV